VTACTAFDIPSDYYDFAYSTGGGIFANSVSLTHGSVVSGNQAVYSGIPYDGQTSGGGVSTQNFTCTDSTISGNSAYTLGGGIRAGSNVTLTRCTVDSNSATYGGGIYATGSTAQVDQSTITGNVAGRGGGIYTRGPTTIANSTIAFNKGFGSFGAGIQAAANVTMTSSIVARNHNVNGTDTDIAFANGKTLSGADNLVMSPLSAAQGVIVSTLDPKLAPLGDHGGLTRTLALLAGSPAIDIGNNGSAFAFDQRGAGFAREVPSVVPDIGAYERQPIDDEIFGTGFD
jgi:predicted outer membrane repeat protein